MAEQYKPVVVGDQSWPLGFEEMQTHSVAGVTIKTDSAELNSQLDLLASQVPSNDIDAVGTSLVFIVDDAFPFRDSSGARLRRIEKDYPGDIYADTRLENFAFHGINKFGTLASMAYGIRAWKTATQGVLGLHSSLIFDKESERSTLLVAKNRAGKSSIGRALEEANDRFDLLSDDWNEVCLNDGFVKTVSPVFSVERPGSDYTLLFESFGKPFYVKAGGPQRVALDRIIEIHSQPQVEGHTEFIRRSLGHIPFLNQQVGDSLFANAGVRRDMVTQEIVSRRQAITDAYVKLTNEFEVTQIVNNPKKNSLSDVVQRVLEEII